MLLVSVPFADSPKAETLADLLAYADHGAYWKQSILEASNNRFDTVTPGKFSWLRA